MTDIAGVTRHAFRARIYAIVAPQTRRHADSPAPDPLKVVQYVTVHASGARLERLLVRDPKGSIRILGYTLPDSTMTPQTSAACHDAKSALRRRVGHA
ncbi:MAG: hypothetical protein U1E29_12760, partial [Coriobacteriia bacterium]|nr:hypothetical protein [Coriobacteriia bacterium]